MEAIRKIIDGNLLNEVMLLPKGFQNKKLEIIIFPIEEKSDLPMLTKSEIDAMLKGSVTESLIGILPGLSLTLNNYREERLTKYESDMPITLKRALKSDCEQIYKMQIEAFKQLLEKYKDYNTNPGAETLERINQRMEQDFTDYYFIQLENKNVGVIRIVVGIEDTCRISPMFILPEYQNKGYAQEAINQVELLYPHIKHWKLETIKQEEKLCHLYEKMGYKATGREEEIQENMSIKYYAK